MFCVASSDNCSAESSGDDNDFPAVDGDDPLGRGLMDFSLDACALSARNTWSLLGGVVAPSLAYSESVALVLVVTAAVVATAAVAVLWLFDSVLVSVDSFPFMFSSSLLPRTPFFFFLTSPSMP